jgi:Flp pilus assembly protein TadD
LDPDDGLAQTILGQLISSTRDFVEAEDHYRAALASAPADSSSHCIYVSRLARVGHFRGALLEARKGCALAPASADAMGRLAQALSLTGSDAEAARWAAIARTIYGGDGFGFLSFRAVEFRIALRERRLEAAAEALV